MAEKTFKLEVITPKKVLFSSEVQSVRAPGFLGSFQVLKNHAPLLSLINVGEIKIVDAEGRDIRYATSGGFVDVKQNKVMLLAETAERADQIDASRAQAAQERAKKRLSEKKIGTDILKARLALERAINRLRVARRSTH